MRQKLFSKEDICVIVRCFKDIINGGSMSHSRIREALSDTEDGADVLKRYSMSQIMTRISYERRKCLF